MKNFTQEPFRRLAPVVEAWPTQTVDDNTFKFVFSSEKVGRDGFVVLNSAIEHENYDRNNIVLWAHDDKQPPIGRGLNIDTSTAECTFDLSFVPREILPFAGTVRDLVAGRWLRAVSLSWQPIEAKRSSDPDIAAIFTRVDMLEISVVPLPALPDALLDARSHGVDTAPLYEWAERAIASRSYQAVPRPQLQAIARAASRARVVSISSSTRAERMARARALSDNGKQERLRRAHLLRTRIAREGSTKENNVPENMKEARGHLQRALRNHKELASHIDNLGNEAGKLRDAQRAVSKTLDELGISDKAVGRAMREFASSCRAILKHHVAIEDAADSAAGCVDRAADCISKAVAE